MDRNQNQPLPFDLVLGGKSPPPFLSAVLGGIDGVKWRIQNSGDEVKIAALEDALKYNDRGKDFLDNLIQTETGILLWSAYYLLWQANKNNLKFSDRITIHSLTEKGMQKRFGSGKLIDAIALTEKLTILLTSAGASLLDVSRDRTLWEIDCPTECATVSPDRTKIAIGWKHHIYLWNLRSGDLIQHIEVDRGWVYSLVFSPDSQLITGRISGDRSIGLWDVNSGKLVRNLQGHTACVKSLAFSPDGKLLASGGWNNIIRFWNLTSGTQLRRIEEDDGLRRIGENLVFSPDSKLLALSSDRYFGRDDGIRLLDVSSGNFLQLLEGNRQPIVNLAFSHDSKLLISQDRDLTVNWWDLGNGHQIENKNNFLEKLEKSLDSINNFALSRNEGILATSNDNNKICLWDIDTGERLKILEGHQEAIESLAFSIDGEILATASKDKTVKLWDVTTGKHLKTLVGHQHWVSEVVFSSDRRSIATSSWDKTVRLWDIASGCQQQIFFGHKGCVRTVNFSPDGSLLVSGGSDKKIYLWEVASGKQIKTIRAYRDILNVTFSPDGTAIASGGWDYFGGGSTLRLWDINRGKQIKFLENYSRTVHSISFSSDGQFLATGGGDMTVTLWDLVTGERVKVIEGHSRSVTKVSFTQDNKSVISASGDRTVRLWNL
jgi:WD40 repeat protein